MHRRNHRTLFLVFKQCVNGQGRVKMHSGAVEIQSCLVSSGDVGCGTFQCFNNNSCEIQGLHHICLTLLHNAGRYDSQGKSFVKDALRCMALGLRQRFSCVSRRCSAVKEMVFSLQRECYSKHQLCLALRDHMDTTGNLVQFHLMFPPGPYVELVNFLLKCGDEVRSWVSRRLRGQCEQHWGALCRSFGRTCPQSDAPQHTTDPPHHHPPCPGLSLLLAPCSSQPERPNQTTGAGSIRSTTQPNLLSPRLRKPMLPPHRATGRPQLCRQMCRLGTQEIQRSCTYYYYYISSRISQSNGSCSFIRVVSLVLQAMQHNLFNLLAILPLVFFSVKFDFVQG
uniref:Stanniocalcin n=1 Tax=Scophthalmus maximus TaxID=52904 RepID=A0A8D3DWF4_SCOMX